MKTKKDLFFEPVNKNILRKQTDYAQLSRALARQNSNTLDLLREFIDNSIGAKYPEEPVDVHIKFIKVLNNYYFEIDDNASGFPKDTVNALVFAGEHKDDINEHGMGLKMAAAKIGTLEYLFSYSKDWNTDLAMLIEGDHLWDPDPYKTDQWPESFKYDHGTRIKLKISEESKGFWNDATSQSVNLGFNRTGFNTMLGAIYRKWITSGQLNLYVSHYEDGEKLLHKKKIEAETPMYYDSVNHIRSPVIKGKVFTGNGWKAKLTAGYQMGEEDAERLGVKEQLPKRTTKSPYKVGNPGFDIVKDKRVIKFAEKWGFNYNHDHNHVRGEIQLVEGFGTTLNKNDVLDQNNIREFRRQLQNFFQNTEEGQEYKRGCYKNRKQQPKISEEDLNSGLTRKLKNGVEEVAWMYGDKNSVENYKTMEDGLEVDIYTDTHIIELKSKKINSAEQGIGQLTVYLAYNPQKTGVLIAPGFSKNAKKHASRIRNEYGFNIKLKRVDELPQNVF